ncbi:MAG: hypothetical protein GX986_03265 [Firmicutes bacterium]|nr:hypothetical protein [Bacillota bacterium]
MDFDTDHMDAGLVVSIFFELVFYCSEAFARQELFPPGRIHVFAAVNI